MKNEELEVRNEKKACTDCLHCKISTKSTEDHRLCFCMVIGRKAAINEFYWANKTVCRNFEDMSA